MIRIKKRVFLIVLDSVGIGYLPDAYLYGDEGSNTLKAISKSKFFKINNMKHLGIFNIDGVDCGPEEMNPIGSFAKMSEVSRGKDTTLGHWEIAGIQSLSPLPTYKDGFPDEIIKKFEEVTGRKVLCNKPYSGTDVIKDYGSEHLKTGDIIVYTSADSVFQIAAHEKVIPVELLYKYCEMARNILVGEHAVGRVIARPFEGEYPCFKRTSNRHDFSLIPPSDTMLDKLIENGKEVISVGKIKDIFAGKGINKSFKTENNDAGIKKTLEILDLDFEGLCFTNLVDFDMVYGHRNDVDGYAQALTHFDERLGDIMEHMKDDDILMITADHGCDPSTESTDHSREYTPLLVYGDKIKHGVNLGVRKTFSDIACTILDYFNIKQDLAGTSFLENIQK